MIVKGCVACVAEKHDQIVLAASRVSGFCSDHRQGSNTL